MKRLLQCLAIVFGGMWGVLIKIPAGALVGGLIGGLLFKYLFGYPDQSAKGISFLAQILVAYVIVSNADLSALKSLPRLVPVAIVYSFLLLAFSLILAAFCSRFFGIDLFTAFFAMPPGGLTGLGLAATEVGADAPTVILFHVIRIIIVVMSVPVIARFFCP